MRRYKNWAHEIIFWKYLLEDLFCQFFPEHRERHFCSPLSALFRGCWKSAAPVAHDLILEEVDEKCRFVVDNPLRRDRVVISPVNSEDTTKKLPSSRGSSWIRNRTRISCIFCIDRWYFTTWRRKWQPTPVLLPGKSHGWTEEPGRLQSMGSQRVGHDWATSLSFTFTLPLAPPGWSWMGHAQALFSTMVWLTSPTKPQVESADGSYGLGWSPSVCICKMKVYLFIFYLKGI